MLSNNLFSAVGLVIILCVYYFSPPTFTARDKPKQGVMAPDKEHLQGTSTTFGPSTTHAVVPNISLYAQMNDTSDLLNKTMNSTAHVEMSNISRHLPKMNTSHPVHAVNTDAVPEPKCPKGTSMTNFSVLDLEEIGDREDEEIGSGNGKGKGKGKVKWNDAAETAAIAGLLTYKMMHGNLCPDVWVGGGTYAMGGSPTYGIGCKHPAINCYCPKWYFEGCIENQFPIAKFGTCTIAWWAYAGGGFILLSCCGCCCMVAMHGKKKRSRDRDNGPPPPGGYGGPPQGGAYPQDQGWGQADQAWGQQPQYGQQYPQQGW